MIPVKGKEPGAFVLTSKKDGQKYVMSERTLKQLIGMAGYDRVDALFHCEWVVLTEEERRLAKEIKREYPDLG